MAAISAKVLFDIRILPYNQFWQAITNGTVNTLVEHFSADYPAVVNLIESPAEKWYQVRYYMSQYVRDLAVADYLYRQAETVDLYGQMLPVDIRMKDVMRMYPGLATDHVPLELTTGGSPAIGSAGRFLVSCPPISEHSNCSALICRDETH
jgi:hypothetical protein